MPIFFVIFLSLAISIGFAEESKSICLNMIVKNESKVIQRCLESVKKIIDYWVIVDTGSSDETQAIIKECLRDIPGELHERPWVNFGHNRNEALVLAKHKADYLLFIDADEILVFSSDFDKKKLDKDYYFVNVFDNDPDALIFQRGILINNHLEWAWKGILHEELVKPANAKNHALLDQFTIKNLGDGARAQSPDKYLKDAALLESALQKDPTNARYVFYLAQSYANAQEYLLALKQYERRTTMGGWDQEVFWSLYAVAKLQEHLQMAPEKVIQSYCKTYQYAKTRAEPLFRLADYLYKNQNYVLGYALAKFALTIPLPNEIVYIERWVYDYGLLFAFANCAYGMGQYKEALTAFEQILGKENIPQDVQQRVKTNIACLKGLLPN